MFRQLFWKLYRICPLDNDTLRAFEKGDNIADDLIEPRRGGENTGRRWSEAKPLQISQESILNPDGVTEILSDLREGSLSPASPPACLRRE